MLTKSLILLSDLGHGPLYFTLTLALIIMGWRRSSFAKGQVSEWLWLGGRLALFWVGGVLLSACLKYHFCAPRPWWIDPQVLPLHPHPAKGFGMPSGHTQSAVGLLLFALCLPRAIAERALQRPTPALLTLHSSFTLLGMLWVAGIAWSRVHLNAHSVAQVFAGGALGLGWAMWIVYCERRQRGLTFLIATLVTISGWCLWSSLSPLPPEAFADSRQAIIDQGQAIPSAPPLTITLLFIVLSFACLSLYYQLRVSAESSQRS